MHSIAKHRCCFVVFRQHPPLYSVHVAMYTCMTVAGLRFKELLLFCVLAFSPFLGCSAVAVGHIASVIIVMHDYVSLLIVRLSVTRLTLAALFLLAPFTLAIVTLCFSPVLALVSGCWFSVMIVDRC